MKFQGFLAEGNVQRLRHFSPTPAAALQSHLAFACCPDLQCFSVLALLAHLRANQAWDYLTHFAGSRPILFCKKREKRDQKASLFALWRRAWDSNPRGCYTLLAFQASSLATRSTLRITLRTKRTYLIYNTFSAKSILNFCN